MTLPLQSTATMMAVGTGALLWIAEGILPFFRVRSSRGRHAFVNLGLAATNLLIILPADIATAAILEQTGATFSGLRGYLPDGAPGTIAILLLLDLWLYLWHRMNHEIPMFWRFHAVHHSDAELDVTSAWRFHPGEILLSELLRLPFLVLTGAGIRELIIYNLLMNPVIQFHHSNVRLPERYDRILRTVIPTPLLHRLHHSTIRSEHDNNYGALLSIWDRLLGTLLIGPVEPTKALGLEGTSGPDWQKWSNLIQKPFRG